MSIRTGTVTTILLLLSGMAGSADQAGGQSGALGSSWADAAKMPDVFTGMWMQFGGGGGPGSVPSVPPYTAQAQKYVDAYKPKLDMPYAEEGCQTPGLPISMQFGPVKFTYAPGLISVYMQATGHSRFIRMNQPMGKTSPKYYGNSVGHWEGDTLVVETKDFLPEITFQYGMGRGLPADGLTAAANIVPIAELAGAARGGGPPGGGATPGGAAPGGGARGGGPRAAGLSANIWGPHGEDMHMVERWRLINPNSLELKLTIHDDTVWSKPNETTRTFTHIVNGVSEFGPFSGEPEEWVCTVSITSFDPDTNTYVDKTPEDMVKYLDKLGR